MPFAWAAGIGAVGSIASGVIGAQGAQAAAQEQYQSTQQALKFAQQQYAQAQGYETPFINYGEGAANQLERLTGTGPGGNPQTAALTAAFNPSDLAATPGYQFTLQQGELANTNSFAAQGLGSSGAALKGADTFATGLASNTYNQQLQNYLAQNQQTYNMLSGEVGTGAQAAGALSGQALQAGSQFGQAAIAGGTALAGGTVGAANAYGGIASGLAGAAQNALLPGEIQQLQSQGLYGAS